jgi:RimJ/RimL family protein N-acetyltransferase
MTNKTILLRQWRDEDIDSFAEMNADPEVMRFLPKPLTRAEAEDFMARLRARIDERGWGLWAVEVDGNCAGFTGLAVPTFSAHFTPCVEIGWRFRREHWGRSIAYSAALAAQAFAFDSLKLPELVSFTTAGNARSRRLMERLGFRRKAADDFLHPSLAADSPLLPHVLYRKRATDPWEPVAENVIRGSAIIPAG